ncbi:hypothetical protein BAUCODRAFT_121746 [Baudoinia panamericana UAMH 10762]|uniref:Uncharacterized protein n=1 Tax=Baudoinia panamericana (strain UAMH 10762) TaxID=717646 RepID=M2MKN1_BAUPA|nr:uncharacterized protein BAUCODRAFT_121746 [Baudoinia panamericana UAMH 10762]EMC97251.1 hypothetical protein BAUCODRAFT_121746 [Baudoinia panamericana UAMH 10762]
MSSALPNVQRITPGMSAKDVRAHAEFINDEGWKWFTNEARRILLEESPAERRTWSTMQPKVKEICRKALYKVYSEEWASESELREDICEWRLDASQYQRRRIVGRSGSGTESSASHDKEAFGKGSPPPQVASPPDVGHNTS